MQEFVALPRVLFYLSLFLSLKSSLLIEYPVCKDRWFAVLPRLIKSPYKIYFLNIPYFMRVRKRLDAEKIRKIG